MYFDIIRANPINNSISYFKSVFFRQTLEIRFYYRHPLKTNCRKCFCGIIEATSNHYNVATIKKLPIRIVYMRHDTLY